MLRKFQELDTISELKECHLSKHENILALLYWFAGEVAFEDKIIRLTFNPYKEYGSHRYRNEEKMLPSLPQGHTYFTVGNKTTKKTSKPLPSYLFDTQSGGTGQNKARIIFRVRQCYSRKIIDQIYITQHKNLKSTYDPEHTYELNIDLLRELRSTNNDVMEPFDIDDETENGSNALFHSSHNRQGYRRLQSSSNGNENDNCCSCCTIL